MLACFADQTGLDAQGGCDLAARLYAVAAQVYGLYVQADWVRRQAFPQTAQGEYLDLHAQMRGLERKQATKARGVVRFTAEVSQSVRQIPAGTVCMTPGLVRFETLEDGEIAAGETQTELSVQAVLAGTAGNVSAGSITVMAVAPVGVSSCTNPGSCTGGADSEADEALRQRVLDTYRRLPNGANAAFYEQEALSFDQVASVCVLPRSRGIGTVDVVVATHSGVPDAALLKELTDYFQQRREIAVDVSVLAPETVSVNVTVQIKAAEGKTFSEVSEQVQAALTAWFDGERLGQNVLRAQLNNLVFSCDGVANCAISLPTADVTIQNSQLPVLGTLHVEALT